MSAEWVDDGRGDRSKVGDGGRSFLMAISLALDC